MRMRYTLITELRMRKRVNSHNDYPYRLIVKYNYFQLPLHSAPFLMLCFSVLINLFVLSRIELEEVATDFLQQQLK